MHFSSCNSCRTVASQSTSLSVLWVLNFIQQPSPGSLPPHKLYLSSFGKRRVGAKQMASNAVRSALQSLSEIFSASVQVLGSLSFQNKSPPSGSDRMSSSGLISSPYYFRIAIFASTPGIRRPSQSIPVVLFTHTCQLYYLISNDTSH